MAGESKRKPQATIENGTPGVNQNGTTEVDLNDVIASMGNDMTNLLVIMHKQNATIAGLQRALHAAQVELAQTKTPAGA